MLREPSPCPLPEGEGSVGGRCRGTTVEISARAPSPSRCAGPFLSREGRGISSPSPGGRGFCRGKATRHDGRTLGASPLTFRAARVAPERLSKGLSREGRGQLDGTEGRFPLPPCGGGRRRDSAAGWGVMLLLRRCHR